MVTEGTDFTWLEGKPYFSKLASSRSIIWEGGKYPKRLVETIEGQFIISASKAGQETKHGRVFVLHSCQNGRKRFLIYIRHFEFKYTICIVDEYGTIASSSIQGTKWRSFSEQYGVTAEQLDSLYDRKSSS